MKTEPAISGTSAETWVMESHYEYKTPIRRKFYHLFLIIFRATNPSYELVTFPRNFGSSTAGAGRPHQLQILPDKPRLDKVNQVRLKSVTRCGQICQFGNFLGLGNFFSSEK